jgi:hypothetical protein
MQKQPNSIDADALLRSLEPVVSKPDAPRPASDQPPKQRIPIARQAVEPAADPVDSAAEPAETALAVRTAPRSTHDAEPVRKQIRQQKGGARARMDVAINPGEGSTALYVRVPRTTHVSLKLLALQNQASLDGPQDLASVVRTAIDEYLDRHQTSSRAAG